MYLWVKYLNTRAVKIDITNCEDIDGLIGLVKDKLGSLKDVPFENITLHASENQDALRPGLSLSQLSTQPGCTVNDDDHPLIVKVIIPTAAPESIPQEEAGIQQIPKKARFIWEESDIDQVIYDSKKPLFELPVKYFAESGVREKNILYCRSSFREQFKFLNEQVIQNKVQGWVLGPPGTGKSTTTLAFVATLDKNDWIVTWIHLGRNKLPVCVRFENGKKKTRKLYNIEELKGVLNNANAEQNHMLVLDGYAVGSIDHIHYLRNSNAWLEDKENRRLVVVCSMSSRGKKDVVEDKDLNVEEFHVFSWTLEEYNQAVTHDELFNIVKNNLDSMLEDNAESTTSRNDLVASKYYFAGGSCRFMFEFQTFVAVQEINDAVAATDDINPYLKGTIGEQSNAVINRLFGLYPAKLKTKSVQSWIISQYALVKLSSKAGPQLIKNLAAAVKNLSNPTFDGWIFEFLFFSKLANSGVRLSDGRMIQRQWPKAEFSLVDADKNDFPYIPTDEGIWLKPVKWNQGGYDAVFIDRRVDQVCFVQITKSDSHKFSLRFFTKFLQSLQEFLAKSEEQFEVKKLEVIFVVDENKFNSFTLQVEDRGSLRAFNDWQYGKEEEKVDILIMHAGDDSVPFKV